MRYFFFLLAAILCLSLHPLLAQPMASDIEIQKIGEDLVKRLNGKGFDGSLIVLDFTDQADVPTNLGAFVAGEVNNHLVNAIGKFTVKARPIVSSPSKTPSILQGMGQTLSQEANTLFNDQEAKIATAAGSGLQTFFRPNAKDKSLKGVDAIVEGTITPMGDLYRLNIRVTTQKSNDVIASVTGDLSNIHALTQLHQQPLESTQSNTGSPGSSSPPLGKSGSTTPDNPDHMFKHLHMKLELVGCAENGRYLECIVRATSEGKDTDLGIHPKKTKIFSQDGGKEHIANTITIADVTKTDYHGWVTKDLIRDVPVTSVIRFEPGETIEVISRLQISCHLGRGNYFNVDLSDIFVE